MLPLPSSGRADLSDRCENALDRVVRSALLVAHAPAPASAEGERAAVDVSHERFAQAGIHVLNEDLRTVHVRDDQRVLIQVVGDAEDAHGAADRLRLCT